MKLENDLYSKLAPMLLAHSNQYDVALSGGVDSIVLLHLMVRLKQAHPQLSLRAIHVNHGLSKHADHWQQHCHDLCALWQVPFISEKVIVERQARQSLEAVARTARYSVFAQHVPSERVLLLGQHLNDQVETFLLRLKRGSGLTGLCAMQQQGTTDLAVNWFRPLLNITRNEIECYAAAAELNFISDESNQDTRFDRNFLRHTVIPTLEHRFKGFSQCVSRSVSLLQQQQNLLNEYSENDYNDCQQQGRLDVTHLLSRSLARQANIVRFWLAKNNVAMLSKNALDQVLLQVSQVTSDTSMCFQVGDKTIRYYRGFLYLVDKIQPLVAHEFDINEDEIRLCNKHYLIKKAGKGLKQPELGVVVSVRFDKPSARFRPHHKPGSNTVKHWLKDAKIPSWQRAQVPLIYFDDTLVQIVGVGVSHQFYSDNGIYWQDGEK